MLSSDLDINRKLAVMLIIFVTTGVAFSSMANAETTTVQVDPAVKNVALGNPFNINITVTDVTALYAWEFRLYFLNTLVACTDVVEGPFLQAAGTTFIISNITNSFNLTHGRVLVACTLMGVGRSANGTGTLATLAFSTIAEGSSNLDLIDTKLSNSNAQPISHIAIGGRVSIGEGTLHDLTVANVKSLKKTVGKGYLDNITVAVQNRGDFSETFNVTVSLNGTDLETHEVTLTSGEYTSMVFQWNTLSFLYGHYTLSAYIPPVVNETNTADNTLVDGQVTVTIPGDINGDGFVDIFDAILLANSFNVGSGLPSWNPDADINTDGIVDIYDAIILANNYNKSV